MWQPCLYCSGDAGEPDHWKRCDGRQGYIEAAADPVDPLHNVRSTDPDTSYLAAFTNRAGRDSQRVRIYRAICEFGPAGCTDYELVDRTQIQLNSANKRRGELRDKGLVVDSGRRKRTPSGSLAIVWVAVEACRAKAG
jgi:hypothetical protein